MKAMFVKIAVLGVTAFGASQARAAYVCELYDRAENAPGGDVPVAVLYSNTNNFELAKKTCAGKMDRHTIIDYWLKWIPADKLPANWQQHDLLSGVVTTPVPSTPERHPGYACIVYDKPESAPNGNVPHSVFYSDVLKLEVVQPACIAKMRALLPNQYRDYEVKWMDNLPEGWTADRLM